MSHTISARNKVTGLTTVSVYDWNGDECFRGEFADHQEAQDVAAREERAMTLRMTAPKDEKQWTLDEIIADMDDDELLKALTE